MRKIIVLVSAMAFTLSAFGQDKIVEGIKSTVTRADIEANVRFLAADEMRGRDTGSPEAAITANYLAASFANAGLKMAPGMTTWFQEVGLQKTLPSKTADLKLGTEVFKIMTDLLVLKGKSLTYDGDFVFVGYGNESDFNGVDVKGKVVVSYTGSSDKSDIRSAFTKDSPAKYKLAGEKGATALIEILTFTDIPWARLTGFFSGPAISLSGGNKENDLIPQLWMRKSDAPAIAQLIEQKKSKGSLVVEKSSPQPVEGKNVVGLIEGTDSKLKGEYIVLSSHYDHIGVNKNGTSDSIYNGARDNALGTTAILEAARYISKHPVKRSVLIVSYTGEEKGLLGSAWYAEHPVVPLNKTVFNMDCDGAGYNDKTIITLIDLNRTTADDMLKKAVEAFGLKLMGDPVPEQHLYERSDNYNFAVKGIPAVDFAPGTKSFDEELNKYYHQAADEVGSLDFEYVEKYIRAYVYGSYLIGNASVTPTWKAGDVFEAEGKKLYGK